MSPPSPGPASTFGTFEAFPHANARCTHDNGPGGRNQNRLATPA